MLRKLTHRPKVYRQEHIPPPSEDVLYFELYDDDRIYGFTALDFRNAPICHLHLEICKWNHRIYKILQTDWIFTKNLIRSMECDKVLVTKYGNLNSQRSYVKLLDKFGFPKPTEYTLSLQEI